MNRLNQQNAVRLALTLVILLSGVAMVPFIDIPAEAIGWELLAGVYEPSLDVDEDSGAPGSVFAFTGSDYPPNSPATVYVDGRRVGSLNTDGSGRATFMLDTAGADPGRYNVTLEVDVNASATEDIRLETDEDLVTPPSGFTGPRFTLEGQQMRTYLPLALSD